MSGSRVYMSETFSVAELAGVLVETDAVVVKMPLTFPVLERGSDLDVWTAEIDNVVSAAVTVLSSSFPEGEVKVSILKGGAKVDLFDKAGLLFRLDLSSSLPYYRRLEIRSSFFDRVLFSGVTKRIGTDQQLVRVPTDCDDLLIRYFEYHEYFATFEQKIKHEAYILKQIESFPLLEEEFFRGVHFYCKPRAFDATGRFQYGLTVFFSMVYGFLEVFFTS